MNLCSKCGANIGPDENFCGVCGTQQLRADGAVVASDPVNDPPQSAAAPHLTDPPAAQSFDAERTLESSRDQIIVEPHSTGDLKDSNEFSSRTSRADGQPDRRSKPKTLAAGKVLNNRYEIVRRIGGGGMGAVYLAKDRNLGEVPRAVKEMIESHLDDSQHEKAIADFKRESLLLTELEHPSIPTVYDYFYDDISERFYLVMKFIPGSDLASRLRGTTGGRIDELTVTEWGMQVADVLHYLHTRPQPIIYRDLKPANLMLDSNLNRIMLIDFGIARWVNKKEKGVTAVGTMGYAPPELFGGHADPRVDIYSLGATMFHLLTGSDPQDNPLLIFDFSKNPRPRQINAALSSEMERLLIRAVEYKPEHRFQSGAEMRDALRAHLEKLRSGQVSYGMPAMELGGDTVAVATVFCGFCGGRIAADDIYCAHCGSRQPLAGGDSSSGLAPRATAKLVVAGTTELDASFNLQKDSNLVGRTDPLSNIFPEVDLSRFDPQTKVSRRHARIWREGEAYKVEDLGSVNGTVINDIIRLEPRQPRQLDSGDRIKMGETTLHFLIG
ncbi:MAG TPA: protein kinase [Pyrinomonadaceae bacterium]|nr:protein kinase [Pyrinomonadaceae bacterium]